ncbi:MAG: PEP-CTERM sorting domain-containing protein [Gammaproteobacteria bacterium]|nr:PEP-CTERM sorting domain-containing protein [Gammaproteobacteria bacterium]MBU1977938.1 PEP-CTERM sorting domain-containing protein [Gammaproteobacteria bacterium]
MKIKQSVLAAAVTAALALGVSQQAAAYVYAASGLNMQDLIISINPGAGGSVGGFNFNFNLTNTATLNGVSGIATGTCFGTPGSNNCGVSPVLDANAVNAPGSTVVTRANNATTANSFTFYGDTPANLAGNWSNSDSVIYTAELVNGLPSSTNQIAESLISNSGAAAANAEIKSTTSFTFTFQVTGSSATLDLSFLADPDMRAAIFGEAPGAYQAQANMNTSFTLQKDGGGGFINWNPQGTVGVNDCIAAGLGLTCVEMAGTDTEDLNVNVGTSTNGTAADSSWGPGAYGLGSYGINTAGLSAGTWTLTLNALTSTLVTRVPEPGMLALMGIGLLGLVVSARRKNHV